MKKASIEIAAKAHESIELGQRRAVWLDVTESGKELIDSVEKDKVEHLEGIDMLYRTLCGVLFNFVPTSGHPGGSISSGRMV